MSFSSRKTKTKIFNNKNIILLADDNHLINESNRNILIRSLGEYGKNFNIILCCDGLDIIRNILNIDINQQIKLIITDENMEFINGSEAIEFMRKLEKKNFINKIIAITVTSHEDKNVLDSIINAGLNYVLSKPLTVSSLKNILNKLSI